jgi:hypothetical protein
MLVVDAGNQVLQSAPGAQIIDGRMSADLERRLAMQNRRAMMVRAGIARGPWVVKTFWMGNGISPVISAFPSAVSVQSDTRRRRLIVTSLVPTR